MPRYRQIFSCRWCGHPEVPVNGSWGAGDGIRWQMCPQCYRCVDVQDVRKEIVSKDFELRELQTTSAILYMEARYSAHCGQLDAAYRQRCAAFASRHERRLRGAE